MAHFYGQLEGRSSSTSRLGTTTSGLRVVAASWQGAVAVRLWWDESARVDMAHISLVPWHGAGVSREIYCGPVAGTMKATSKE